MPQYDDSKTTIAEIRQMVDKFVVERDWKGYHTAKSLAIALSIEASELLEHFLFQKSEELPADPKKREEFENEMADIMIYLMSLANSLNIPNFSEVITRKIEKNGKKYPIENFSGSNYKKQ